MSICITDSLIEWNVLAADPDTRVSAARDYALGIFRNTDAAAKWFAQADPAILEGRCIIAEACKTPGGFVETICELVRIGVDRVACRAGR
jgi:hypothetical protein